MKVLVTGSTGFIGSRLVEFLIKDGHEVHCLIRPESDLKCLEGLDVRLIRCRYSDKTSLAQAVRDMEVIFHLAARIEAPNWDAYYTANTLSTKHLIEACAEYNPGLKRFVFVSSIAASGPPRRGEIKDECSQCLPVSPYGRSKLMAEEIVQNYAERIPIVIMRPANVLGARQKELVLILDLLKKRIMPMIGSKESKTSICFVEDLVRALAIAAVHEKAVGNTYFIADRSVYSWRHMLKLIAGELRVYPAVVRIPYPVLYAIALLSEGWASLFKTQALLTRDSLEATRKYEWIYRTEKIRNELGFKTLISFENGIRDIVDSYKKINISSPGPKG